MRNKIIAIVMALGLTFAVAACGSTLQSKPNAAPNDYQKREQQATAENQTRLSNAVPYPQLNDSLERRQLRERLLRFNKPDKIAYINLFSSTGQVITSLPIRGKVSSVNSQMTTEDQVTKCDGWQNPCRVVTHAPGDDGSYGTNGDAIFFFTTENVYVEWNGTFLLTDAPLKVNSATIVTYDKSSTPSSTGEGK